MQTYKPHDRVANRTSRRIDKVDGVLTTHTQHGWTHAWTVTDAPDHTAPLPFAAKKGVPAVVAVPAMCAVVLTALAVSLLMILDGRPDRAQLMLLSFAGLGVWCALLVVPAVTTHRTRSHTGQDGGGLVASTSAATQPVGTADICETVASGHEHRHDFGQCGGRG